MFSLRIRKMLQVGGRKLLKVCWINVIGKFVYDESERYFKSIMCVTEREIPLLVGICLPRWHSDSPPVPLHKKLRISHVPLISFCTHSRASISGKSIHLRWKGLGYPKKLKFHSHLPLSQIKCLQDRIIWSEFLLPLLISSGSAVIFPLRSAWLSAKLHLSENK